MPTDLPSLKAVPHRTADAELPPSARRIENAMSALMQARAALLAADPELAEDEGELLQLLAAETAGHDALDVLRRLVRAAILTEQREQSANRLLIDLKARRDRYRARTDGLRGAVLQALQALELKRLAETDFTITRQPGPCAVVITDAAQLPAEYIREKIIHEPDKLALREALAQGEVIDDALLANGADILVLRTA